ncbi:MAG: Ig-like domain-containing protein [Flavobacteriaceae bacterium]
MKIKQNFWLIWVFMLALAVVGVSCSDDDNEEEAPITVNKIVVDGVTDDIVVLEVADTYTVNLTLTPDDAVDKDEYTFEYSSSNEEVFKVSEEGVITALGVGEAALRIYPVNNTDLWAIVTIKVNSKLFLIETLTIDESYQDFYIGVDKTVDLSALITIAPEYATNKDLLYTSSNADVASVTRRGVITTLAPGDATITIATDDGSDIETTISIHVRNTSYQDLSRTGWAVTTSHQYFADGTVVGTPESLIDDPTAYGTNPDEPTCLCMVKPGKSLGGITVAADEEVHFVIDMGQEEEFSAFRLRHRVKNTSKNLRLIKASVYGSNDGTTFTPVAEDLSINVDETEATVDLGTTAKYRYFKLTYDQWASGGSTVQVSDFNILETIYEEL